MRSLITLVVVLAVVLGGIGFYLGWFSISNTAPADGNKSSFSVEVDKQRINSDIDKGKERLKDTRDKIGKTKPAEQT